MEQMEQKSRSDRRVLVVEDDGRMREMLLRALGSMEFSSSGVGSAEDALRALDDEEEFGIVIADLNLPGMHGLDLCEVVRKRSPQTQIIVLTGYGDLDSAKQAIRLDVVDFLTKPCRLSELESALDRALRRRLHGILMGPKLPIEDPAAAAMFDEEEDDAEAPKRLRDHERKVILDALARHDGNRSETAKELGISVRTLYYRLSEYERQGYIART
jgi:DNA-binding NtrC family response regulator